MKNHSYYENLLERMKLSYLAASIIYVIFSLLPTESIKRLIPYGTELDIILFISSAGYILTYAFEVISKYFNSKPGKLSKIYEIIFGTLFIFILDFIPFIIDLKSNQYTYIIGWILIILFSLRIIITFILQPLNKLYYFIINKKGDKYFRNMKNLIDEQYNIKLKEIDIEYKNKLEEINNKYK